jgi:hypothetical protein
VVHRAVQRFALLAVLLSSGCEDADPLPEPSAVGQVDASDGEDVVAATDTAVDVPELDSGPPQDASEAGTDARHGGSEEDAPADVSTPSPPAQLSGTGLYQNLTQNEALAAGVVEYRPRFELWSDGADKRRFAWLPQGARIDTSDMDYWLYPVGTRFWKEFRRNGVRVETRLLEKTGRESWSMMAYAWNAEGTDAAAVPNGATDVLGTAHDIPSRVMCTECHDNVVDRVLGFSAVQLSHALGGTALDDLVRADRLTVAPSAPIEVPGSEAASAALGYLHANCGNCHNPRSGIFSTVQLEFWLGTASLQTVQATPTYRTTVGVPLQGVPPSPDTPALRILPGDPAGSAVHQRMSVREPLTQMPPLGTELPDAVGLSAVATWIAGL